MDLAGRWKPLFAWGVMAAAVLICVVSVKLPIVAAVEQGMIVVSDQLPALANDAVTAIMDGTGGPDTESTSSTSDEPTATEDDPDPAVGDSGAAAPSPEEELADFLNTRLGRVPAGTNGFPARDVDITGDFVLGCLNIYSSHFSAIKHRSIPETDEGPDYYSAITYYNNGIMDDGFSIYKNMNYDPLFGDCYIAISSDGAVTFNGLSMEVTELYAQQLLGVRTFPIYNFWTTDPGNDLPVGAGEIPPAPDAPFYGYDYHTTVIKMTADYIEIPNFSLSVRPGTTSS